MSVIFFLEDPGAVGFIAEVLTELEETDIDFHVIASNYATQLLVEKNIRFNEINSKESIKDFIIKNKIKLLFTGTSQNPKSLGLSLIDYAKERKIITAAFVDSSADYHLRFKGNSKNPLNHIPDWLIVPDNHTRELFTQLGFEENKVLITGSPNYEAISIIRNKLEIKGQKYYRKRIFNKDFNKPVIVFVDEHSNNGDQRLFKSEDYNFRGREGLSNRNEIITGEVLDILSKLNIENYFIVRLHPKSDKSDYLSLSSEIDEFNSSSNSHELVFSADLIIGMTSILLMESFLLGKEVISVIPKNSEIDWAPPGLLDSIDCVTNSKDLINSIKRVFRTEKTYQKQAIYEENSPREEVKNFIISRLKD